MTGVVSQTELVYRNRTFQFLLFSFFVHALILAIMSLNGLRPFGTQTAENKTIDIDLVEMPKQHVDKLTKQIVETTLAQKAEDAAKDAYLGAQTQVVDRQTKAATTAPFNESKPGGAQGRKHSQMTDLGVKMNLKPMGHLGPGAIAATSDHLRDVTKGAQTLLNTKEFAYFSFYQRVRKQLEQYWEPGLRQRLKNMFARGRQLAADREHATRVLVMMNGEGIITKIQVESTSGLLDLDQAAIEAFNRAGPFPNPPRGLVEADGNVKVEWEFVLKT